VTEARALFGALFRPNERLVDFNDGASAAHRRKVARAESLANAMGHEPYGFEGYAKHAVKLVRTHTLL
jgi:hypothetical protein